MADPWLGEGRTTFSFPLSGRQNQGGHQTLQRTEGGGENKIRHASCCYQFTSIPDQRVCLEAACLVSPHGLCPVCLVSCPCARLLPSGLCHAHART